MLRIAELPKYEAYKDSGVDWLGEVPVGWKLTPVRGVLEFRNEKNDPIVTDQVLSLSIANGVTRYSDEGRGGNKRKDDLTAYKIARPGDIVMNSMNVIVGAVGVSKYFGAISPVYYALHPKNGAVSISYYERIFQNESFQRGLLRLGKGILIKIGDSGKMNTIRMKISRDDIKTLLFPEPDYGEQLLIAKFLDKKTTQIDEAIAIKEQQITLLKERKQIIIQKAVTQGLDPNVPMKDSGVDWIGKIPAHWEVVKLKLLANKIVDGAHFTPTYVDKGVPFLRVTDLTKMTSGRINWDEVRYIPEKEHKELIKRAKADKGDILLSKNGTIGLTAVIDWDVEFSFFVSLCLIKLKVALSPNYFASYFNSPIVDRQITFGSSRTSVTNLHLEKIKELLIILPPVDEQDEIGAYIDDIAGEYDPAVDLQQQQIEKLKEYKTTLINSAVTGKIRITPDMVEA